MIIIIALVALMFLVNPSLNGLVLSGINYVINHVINGTTNIPTLGIGSINGPCSSWGLVNVSLVDGESLFIEVVNGSYVYLLTNSQLRSWGGGPGAQVTIPGLVPCPVFTWLVPAPATTTYLSVVIPGLSTGFLITRPWASRPITGRATATSRLMPYSASSTLPMHTLRIQRARRRPASHFS